MATSLLALSDGHLSLEFETADIPVVRAAILSRFGGFENSDGDIVKVYRFGGCRFAFQNEWDDPCLVSDSDDGDSILRLLYSDLHAGQV